MIWVYVNYKERKGIQKSYTGPGISWICKNKTFFISVRIPNNEIDHESFKWRLLAQRCLFERVSHITKLVVREKYFR